MAKKSLAGRDKLFLLAAVIGLLLSVYLWFTGQRTEGTFVGIWVPTVLAAGAYFKLLYK